MVRTFLKVYMELGSYFLFLQEQIKDIIINPTPESWRFRERIPYTRQLQPVILFRTP